MEEKVMSLIFPYVKEIYDSPVSIDLIAGDEMSREAVSTVFKMMRANGLIRKPNYFSNVYKLTAEGYHAVKAAYEKAEELKRTDAKPIDLLLAEDDPDDVLIFEEALEETRRVYKIRHAFDGDQLFVQLKKFIPDLLFLDIHMPCKDGISCILEIRKNKTYDRMPVIMWTGSDNKSHIDKAYAAGANSYIVKSTSVKKLADKIASIFELTDRNLIHYPSKKDFVLN